MSTDPRRGPIPEGRDTNFEFPTEYPLKVAGKNIPTLESTVVSIVSKHVDDFDSTTVTVRESKGGKYLAVSVSFTARSKKQLDSIYTELTSHADIVWAL
jgi:putative lipoic acid-binding regulatory protein